MGLFDKLVGGQKTMLAPLNGSNPLTKALGLSGEQGEYFQANNENAMLGQYNSAAGAFDPTAEYGKATDSVRNNAILGQLFGQGGALERANSEEQRLASQGFQLTGEDREAYGQASGDIARMFGQQEQSLAQSLADRGLSAAPSGAAGVAFSGLAGNKNEMLAKAQMDIANKRMENTMQRLNSTRSYMSTLGAQGQQAIGDQYDRQHGKLDDLARGAEMTTNQNMAANQANLQSMQDKRGAKGKTLMEGLGAGLFSSAANIGAAPGKFTSSAAGAAGESMGSGGAGGGMKKGV